MADKYWMGTVSDTDDVGGDITDTFIDGRSFMGPWGRFNQENWDAQGVGRLGTGFGQKYRKQADGRWLKVEG